MLVGLLTSATPGFLSQRSQLVGGEGLYTKVYYTQHCLVSGGLNTKVYNTHCLVSGAIHTKVYYTLNTV